MFNTKNLHKVKRIEVFFDDDQDDFNHYLIIPQKKEYEVLFHGKHEIEGYPHNNRIFTADELDSFLNHVFERKFVNIVIKA